MKLEDAIKNASKRLTSYQKVDEDLDDWVAIDDNWDANYFFNDGKVEVSLYKVIDGMIDTRIDYYNFVP